jgi:glucose-6-phosphate isomerase
LEEKEMPWTELTFGNRTFFPDVRKLGDMKEVIYDKQFLARANLDIELYYMFRNVARDEADAKRIEERGLRYDITIIPPNTLGVEFVKTAGHYHPYLPGSNLTYPELYEVQEGEAHYLLQRRSEERHVETITDVVLVKARRGDKVLIPPNYGHVTINPADSTLKMANWVARTFSSIYEPIKQKGGAAYFELTTGEFIKNERYGEVPDIRHAKPAELEPKELELSTDGAMYELLREPEKLEFLIQPAGFFD